MADRLLRKLPYKRGGKLNARYAVFYDGGQIGEVLRTKRYGLWYGKVPGSPHLIGDFGSDREAAAKAVVYRHLNPKN